MNNENTAKAAEHDRVIVEHIRKGTAPPMYALCGLMRLRAAELTRKILVETDPMNMARLQGAARELLRWADYPAELEEKECWLKQEAPHA